MNKKEQAIQLLLQQKLLPLYYHDDASVSINILKALYKGGIRMVEYTHRGANALNNFVALKKVAKEEMHDLLLGIGTIKNTQQTQQYLDAEADFIVCPTINTAVAKVVQKADLLWIPGCLTPTEIAQAEEAGASIVKIFPGNILGQAYISAIKELFPDLKFMPTGGVEAEESNLNAWFKAGVVAVGMGSKLITKELVSNNNYQQLMADTQMALQLINKVT
jgi:2-dehydro-3-deoxyphosphogluconate aldolase / (4S)-4-hydroxy-2-oxoglutarate aldolase